jgi:hypothetical protein
LGLFDGNGYASFEYSVKNSRRKIGTENIEPR